METINNENLKKKICKVIADVWVRNATIWDNYQPWFEEKIANALIAAGIVDKSDYASMKETAVRYKAEVSKAESRAKDAEHRAEVAERALDKATELAYTYRTQDDTLSCSSCPFDSIFDSIFDRCKERGLYEDCSKRWKEELLQKAEKELAEEEKE